MGYSGLIEFSPSDSVLYRLILDRIVEWSPSCLDMVSNLVAKVEDITRLVKQASILFYLYIGVVVVSVISVGTSGIAVGCKSPRIYKGRFHNKAYCLFCVNTFPSYLSCQTVPPSVVSG